MQRGRIGWPFIPFNPHKVRQLYRDVDSHAAKVIYFALKILFPVVEDWDKDPHWVWGVVQATKEEIQAESRVSRGGWYKAWPQLLDAGFVVEDQGRIILPFFKLKGYDAISEKEIRERFAQLEELHKEELDQAEDDNIQSAEITHNSENETPLRGHECPLRGHKSPLRGHGSSFKRVLKEKKTLSLNDIISGFYKGIGQNRISKQKRERGSSIFRKLRKDEFSVEDIAFAVDWTLDNAKEKPYDFSIIEHTIGQAIAAREKQESEDREMEERERMESEQKAEHEREEEERDMLEAHKQSLSAEEREELRNQAETELSESGKYKRGFITELLIEIKENEILRKKLAEQTGVEADDD